MIRSKMPWVFRIAAALLVTAIVVGGWWQRQPVGPRGRAFLAHVSRACPAAAHVGRATVADTAHELDRWAYARIGNLLLGGPDRCARGVAR